MSFNCQLVKLDDGFMAIKVRLGQFEATHPLPDQLAVYNKEQLTIYFNDVVPRIIEGLREQERQHRQKMIKRAKNAHLVPRITGEDPP